MKNKNKERDYLTTRNMALRIAGNNQYMQKLIEHPMVDARVKEQLKIYMDELEVLSVQEDTIYNEYASLKAAKIKDGKQSIDSDVVALSRLQYSKTQPMRNERWEIKWGKITPLLQPVLQNNPQVADLIVMNENKEWYVTAIKDKTKDSAIAVGGTLFIGAAAAGIISLNVLHPHPINIINSLALGSVAGVGYGVIMDKAGWYKDSIVKLAKNISRLISTNEKLKLEEENIRRR